MAENPYESPNADVAHSQTPVEFKLVDPKSVDAGRGWGWIADGFNLFKQSWLNWILMLIVWFVIAIAVNLVPIIGMIAFGLSMYIFVAGIMLGCKSQDEGKPFQVSHLFAGFSNKAGKIVLMTIAVNIVSVLVMALTMGSTYFAMLSGDQAASQSMMNDLSGFWLSFLTGMALLLPLMMAVWFAPVLIVINDVSVLDAFKLSFLGCLKNVVPFLIFGLIALVLYIVSFIPLALGLFVFIPTMFAAMYVAYKDIFIAQ